PHRDALFGAVAGAGAWRSSLAAREGATNEISGIPGISGIYSVDIDESGRATPPGSRPLSCTTGVPLSRALVATGFGYERGRRLAQGQVLSAVLPRVRDIRRNGACSVDLCTLAAGNVDGYYERGVQYWDIAAGTLIAREAGAVVGGLAGETGRAAEAIRARAGALRRWQ